MTTKPSILLKDDCKCRNVSSTEGLDILCTAIELESESSIKTTTYCTLIINECSSDNNIINNAAKCLKVDKVKNIGRKLCSREGCTTRSRGDGLCLKHGSTRNRFVVCRHEGCSKKAQLKGLCRSHGGRRCKVDGCSNITVANSFLCIDHSS